VRGLRAKARLRGLAQALLVQEAAQRGDVSAVGVLLDEVDHWHAFGSGPPHFVLECVERVAQLKPGHAVWRESLSRWLQLWDLAALGELGIASARIAGLVPVKASATAVPPGVSQTAWFLHQASRQLGQDDAEALACVHQALISDPDLMNKPAGEFLKSALPELERRARGHALAKVLRREGTSSAPSLQLVDAADLLDTIAEGRAILEAAQDGDIPAAEAGLAALADRSDLPSRLVHHLAIIELRTAEEFEDRGDTVAAEPCWRRAWRYWWLHFAGAQVDSSRQMLFDHLLGMHRKHMNTLLAREAMDAARRHWNLVQELPSLADALDKDASKDLEDRVALFRDRLATDYLVTTREAMRYGAAPEGCQADYDRGLGHLRRLLSLDRENVRLLTAFVEICNEWFLDLYRIQAGRTLADQVERFMPFAAKLFRLVEDHPADLAARAVLSDFYKFRGFIQRDREKKAALYREALRLNPGNDNVRDLLAQLGPPQEQPPAAPTPPEEPPIQ
jgi:tetratricopeptide (TPR) repeat protein